MFCFCSKSVSGVTPPEKTLGSAPEARMKENDPMKMNPLGRTGLMVSDLCLGTMT